MDISKYIDHSLLKSTATESDIIQLCEQAIQYNFNSVCVNSSNVHLAKQVLNRTDIKICAVVGFPLGVISSDSKMFDAKNAIESGADEIDMVINLGLLKSKNYLGVLKDISNVKRAIQDKTLKVIIEISELSKNEIIKASEICIDAKADFIVTSTGFSKSGSTLTAVKIIKKTVKNRIKIKASGGINNSDTAQKYVDVGVSRIGTLYGIDIINTVLEKAS